MGRKRNDGLRARLPSPVLVTGATGFVGSHVVEALLLRGARVRVLVRSARRLAPSLAGRVEVVEGNLWDGQALRKAVEGVRAVVHLAAVLKAARREDFERTNVEGTRRLAEAFRDAAPQGGRFVYVGSLAAAGPSPKGRLRREEDPESPVSAYGQTKLAGERAAFSFQPRICVVALRPGVVYGPGDRDVLQIFRMASRGLVFLPGTGRERVSLVHVSDLVRAVLAALRSRRVGGRTYFVSDGKPVTWLQVAAQAGKAFGKHPRVFPVPLGIVRMLAIVGDLISRLTGKTLLLNSDKAREAAAGDWTCDSSRIRRELGFRPRVELAEGFQATAKFYQDEGWL